MSTYRISCATLADADRAADYLFGPAGIMKFGERSNKVLYVTTDQPREVIAQGIRLATRRNRINFRRV